MESVYAIGDREFLSGYEALCSLTEKLLAGARGSEWDNVVALQADRQRVLERLKRSGGSGSAEMQDPEHKADLIRKILEMESQVRDLVEKGMSEISEHFQAERQLLQAYGGHSIPRVELSS